MDENHQYEAIVIGGGPAGSTAAAILAEKGHTVLILEKEKFPRYHIGESLMPFCYFTLERLGVVDQLKESAYPKKYSVQFVREDGEVSQPFYFFQHLDHEASTTWQVLRSDFDLMLLNNARRRGAEVREQVAVRRIIKRAGVVVGVEALSHNGEPLEFTASVTIDASGRDCVSTVKEGWRKRDPKLNKVSIWTYYRGAKRDPGLDEGATTIAYIEDKGWFWYIPMSEDLVSVGVVAERKYLYRNTRDRRSIFEREVESNPWIVDHLNGGKQFGPHYVTGEYSYRSRYCAADGLVLVGDAFAFLDPVFSSGVFLALWSGEMAGDAVHDALAADDCSGERFADYGLKLCRGIEAMRKLVYAFYDPDFSFGSLLRQYPHLRGRLTDCLIGDLFRKDYTELFSAIGQSAKLPESLGYGWSPANG